MRPAETRHPHPSQSMYDPSARRSCRDRKCLHCGQCDATPRFTTHEIPHVIKCMNPTDQFWPARTNPGAVHVRQSRQPATMNPLQEQEPPGYVSRPRPSWGAGARGSDRNDLVALGHPEGEGR
ncbi:hypothetical protein SGPA1_80132 [Streptomyces misionensis JCM 4497]